MLRHEKLQGVRRIVTIMHSHRTQTYLTCVGDAKDPSTWSGTPYHLLEAGGESVLSTRVFVHAPVAAVESYSVSCGTQPGYCVVGAAMVFSAQTGSSKGYTPH